MLMKLFALIDDFTLSKEKTLFKFPEGKNEKRQWSFFY